MPESLDKEDFLDDDDEDASQKKSRANKPPKGEAWGLGHHVMKVLIFLVALRVRKVIEEVDMVNALFLVLKVYREEKNKDVGLHYLQSLLDWLHKTCIWSDKGSLPSHLKAVDKTVLEKPKKKYPEEEAKKKLDWDAKVRRADEEKRDAEREVAEKKAAEKKAADDAATATTESTEESVVVVCPSVSIMME